MSWLDKLRELLEASDLRVTFDSERDITKPCWCCGRSDVPRDLAQIGHYLNPHRDSMMRPLCAGCNAQIGAIGPTYGASGSTVSVTSVSTTASTSGTSTTGT